MQKSPIACRPLADWKGQSVRFRGWLNLWETANKTGDTACLLKNVRVAPYKGSGEQVRTLDHLWIYLNQDNYGSDKLERLGQYSAVGQVVSYTRSNGTKDYAIKIKSFVPIEDQVALLKLCKEPTLDNIKTKTELLQETITLLEIEELNFDVSLPYEKLRQLFQDEYEICSRHVEINERYQAKQQYRPRSKTKVVDFSSVASKSTKVPAKGFATNS